MRATVLAILASEDHTGAVLAGIAAIIAALLSGAGLIIGALTRRTTTKVNAAVNDRPGPPISERVAGIEATVQAHRIEAVERFKSLDAGQLEILRRLPE